MASSTEAFDVVGPRLRRLIDLGYQFVHPTGPDGSVSAVVGVRVHETVIDVIRLYAENDVIATRVPAGEVDILAPRRVVWQSSGHAADVLDELLALPEECTEETDQRVTGCWLPVKPGSAKWLIAPA